MLRGTVGLLCLLAASHQLTIEELVVPNAVKLGEDAELQCRFELEDGERVTPMFYVKWWWTPLDAGPEERQLIYQRIHGHPAQITHTGIESTSNDTIELRGLSLKDSGTYECEVSNESEDRKHQELIVYTEGSGPQLNVTTTEDGPDEDTDEDVEVTCVVDDVAPVPDLVITIDGNEIKPSSEVVSLPVGGLYAIVANATLSRANVRNGAEIACELFYKDEKIIHAPYKATHTFVTSGPEDTTTEAASDTTQNTDGETETVSPDGGGAVFRVSSLALLLAAAGLALQ